MERSFSPNLLKTIGITLKNHVLKKRNSRKNRHFSWRFLMQNEENEFLHQVRIGGISLPYTLNLGVRFSYF